MTGYCFRCKAMKEIKDAVETRTKNGRPAVTGACVTCGTKIFKIGVTPSAPDSGPERPPVSS